MKYKVTLYDPLTKKTSMIAELPERRQDPKRAKGRFTVHRWLVSVYGREWFKKNRSFIGIVTDRRKG